MSATENKQLVVRQFELLNGGRIREAAALWAERSWNHGREASPATLERVYTSLAELKERHAIHEIIAEGDWVAVRTTCSGLFSQRPAIPVNSGIFSGLEPNGMKYSNQHMHMFRVEHGKLVEHWANRDDLAVAQQIGLELRPKQ